MTEPGYIEVAAKRPLRLRIRTGLDRMRRHGFAIEWHEQRGWQASIFTIWGRPLLLGAIEQAIGHRLNRPSRGQHLDVLV